MDNYYSYYSYTPQTPATFRSLAIATGREIGTELIVQDLDVHVRGEHFGAETYEKTCSRHNQLRWEQ